MSKSPKKLHQTTIAKRTASKMASPTDFDDVLALIDAARTRAVATVNTVLIDLHWSIGEHIATKVANEGWGKGTVQELAGYIQRRQPNARG
jgi:DNA-binding FrmR family transcriptional regulator